MLNRRDTDRLDRAMTLAGELDTPGSFLRFAQAPSDARKITETAAALRFDHVAVLVTPDSHHEVGTALAAGGFTVQDLIPSVVVRDRLAHRHGVPAAQLDVQIVRGTKTTAAGDRYGIEVFSIERANAQGTLTQLADDQREGDEEAHIAYRISSAEPDTLEAVRKMCRDELSLNPDGAGYNPHEDADSGGRTVLYFRADPSRHRPGLPRRLELFSEGHFSDVITVHDQDTTDDDQHTALLSVLAGHWSARAVHIAAQTGIADHLRHEPRTAAEVATLLGHDTDATRRLLHYLAHLGFLHLISHERYTTTARGALLRSDNPFSDLTRLYGSEFYEAWGEFGTAIQTGGTGFRHRFGTEHFDHFTEHPNTARTFDRSMQAVTHIVADALPSVYDFPTGSTVIDVGGGNGTLLRTILQKNPDLTGILFDRDHVTRNPTPHTEQPQLHTIAGDFFKEVPTGGDTYLLSRILHDWNDQDCLRILHTCRQACTPGRKLLILERLLPDTPDPNSLAAAWDMQMLTVTGGRERHQHQYQHLLNTTGFHLTDTRPLPLHMNLLIAHPT